MPNSRRSYFLQIVLACVATLTATSPAQQPATAQPSGPITLNVVVTPKSGAPVADLQQSDFAVLDSKAQRPITSFKAFSGPQAPIHVILLIDAVNVDFTRLSYERQQIENFLRADGSRLAYPTSLAIFTDNGVNLQQGFSTDGNALDATLQNTEIGLRAIRRSSGFYGAEDRLQFSLNAMHSIASRAASIPGRKVIVWISPGWPYLTGPRVDLDSRQQQQIFSQVVALSSQLRQADITLYSVDPLSVAENLGWEFYYQDFVKGITKPSDAEVGDLSLQVIAIQSGGLALSASNDIAGQIQRSIADASTYYELSFDPPPSEHTNDYHQIQVTVDKPGLIARTRTGYYSQP